MEKTTKHNGRNSARTHTPSHLQRPRIPAPPGLFNSDILASAYAVRITQLSTKKFRGKGKVTGYELQRTKRVISSQSHISQVITFI